MNVENFETSLTKDEKEYLDKKFNYHIKTIDDRLDAKINEDLTLLGKYKGDLAKNYELVRGSHHSLIGCMKEIIDKQDELIGIVHQLGDFVARIENFFLDEKRPQKQKEVGTKNQGIAELFDSSPIENIGGICTRIVSALRKGGIEYTYQLYGKTVHDIAIIPNMGQRAIAILIYLADKKENIDISFNGRSFPAIRRLLNQFKEKYGD